MASAEDAELAEMLMGTFVDDGISDDEALELEQVSAGPPQRLGRALRGQAAAAFGAIAALRRCHPCAAAAAGACAFVEA